MLCCAVPPQVTAATFDKESGLWTVTSASGAKVKGRVLVCADGATSQLATKLGYCTEAPRGVCSRAFVAGGTHNAKFDGVCFYPKWSLPGYAALFRCVWVLERTRALRVLGLPDVEGVDRELEGTLLAKMLTGTSGWVAGKWGLEDGCRSAL